MNNSIRKVLIANRGEIALRIIRTLRSLGIESHAVYTEADKDALHRKSADISHSLGADPKSYLDINKIVSIAKKAGVDAVHPGYGFLSENSYFSDALTKAGISFIGPDSKAMNALGDKVNAKKLARKLKIPVLEIKEGSTPKNYPILIKAAGGGGGRGMRIVEKASDFKAALESAKREAKSSFGNDKVFIEPYLKDARHIEVQVIGDKKGDTRHIFDRDCSLQRQHQKIIEEAPAPLLSDSVRRKMCESAIKLCKAAKYSNLATAEFLVDKRENFYFLEVNTRLQVEHTVSEEITGLDFVKLQIQIAEGKSLNEILPKIIIPKGHAIQCRICAESPENNFLPSSGEITAFNWPERNSVRMDSGFKTSDIVSHNYDSLIAKLIVSGDSRNEALSELREILPKVELHGILNNLSFLSLVTNSPEFKNSKVNTQFLKNFISKVDWSSVYKKSLTNAALPEKETSSKDIWEDFSSFRISGLSPKLEAEYKVNNGIVVKLPVLPHLNDENPLWVQAPGLGSLKLERLRETRNNRVKSENESLLVKSSLPGKIIDVKVKAGEKVRKGDSLFMMESMKIEHTIKSELDSEIAAIKVRKGEQVAAGALLLEFRNSINERSGR